MNLKKVTSIVLALVIGASAQAQDMGIASAQYEVDLDVYPHRIMGSIREKGVLTAVDTTGVKHTIDLRLDGPGHNVFEDIAPRVVDATGNGNADVVVVESSQTEGAQLAIYGLYDGVFSKLAATPHIGTRNRWLAPVGIGDLDGDGTVELAYVDRPHLARTLRVWSLQGGVLREVANLGGVTNHRIGDEVIFGGLRDCGSGPEMIMADGRFRNVLSVQFQSGALSSQILFPLTEIADFDRAMAC